MSQPIARELGELFCPACDERGSLELMPRIRSADYSRWVACSSCGERCKVEVTASRALLYWVQPERKAQAPAPQVSQDGAPVCSCGRAMREIALSSSLGRPVFVCPVCGL